MHDLKYCRELLCAESSDSQRPAIAPTFKPLTVQAESAKKGADTACHVIQRGQGQSFNFCRSHREIFRILGVSAF
jgi:hypothetical protein